MRTLFLVAIGAAALSVQVTGHADATATPSWLAQNTAPPSRGAAGNGNMGIGEGIRQAQENEREAAAEREELPRHLLPRNAEPAHGGNERDMEHRGRYAPEKEDRNEVD